MRRGRTPLSVGATAPRLAQRRRLSQLDLALEAGVSARHLSFVETGRSRPSEQMVLHLAEQLDVPLRERNALLLAGRLRARPTPQRGLDEPELDAVKDALDRVAAPATSRSRPSWSTAVEHGRRQRAASRCSPRASRRELLEPPVNVLRLSLHPDGHGAAHREPRRVARAPARPASSRQADATGDPELEALLRRAAALPAARGGEDGRAADEVVVPLRLRAGDASSRS